MNTEETILWRTESLSAMDEREVACADDVPRESSDEVIVGLLRDPRDASAGTEITLDY